MQLERRSESSHETAQVGKELGRLLREQLLAADYGPGTETGAFVVALSGDLGAGKTTFTQGVAAGMGIDAAITSPTFTLVNEYETPEGLWLLHMDSYRLGESTDVATLEAAAFGIDELMETECAVLIIEWAERVRALLPDDTLFIRLSYSTRGNDTERTLHLCADGARSQQFISRLADRL